MLLNSKCVYIHMVESEVHILQDQIIKSFKKSNPCHTNKIVLCYLLAVTDNLLAGYG